MGEVEYYMLDILDRKKMSQAELARISGVSKSSISRYLQGEDVPISKLKKIADALGATVDELLGIDGALTERERELVGYYRAASDEEKDAILQVARTFAGGMS